MFDLGGMNIDVSVEMGAVKGERGWYYEPHMTEDGTLTWTNNGGLENPQTVNIRGPVGKGFQIKATFATLEELEAVTDAESGDFFNVGTEAPYTIYLYDGKDFVSQGQLQGPTGEDGFSPTVSGVKENGVLTLTVTDKNGTQTYSVADGKDGIGKDGVDGEDGFSPVITVDKVEGATNLTITTKEGTQTASIPDGTKGDKGDAGQTAYAAAQQGGYTGTEADFYADLAAMDGLANWFAAY